MSSNSVEILSFADCQSYFKQANHDLFNLLSEMMPPTLNCFIKVNYKYGDLIAEKGHLLLSAPPFSALDTKTRQKIQSELSYCSIPLGYVTSHIAEVFIEEDNFSGPLNLMDAGTLFGLFESIDYLQNIESHSFWTISAGVRNIFTLANISDQKKIKYLSKKINVPLKNQFTPFSSHWLLFKSILDAMDSPWQCPVIFFGKTFFDHIEKSNNGHLLKEYLYQQGWRQMVRFISDFDVKLILRNILLDALTAKNYSPNSYIAYQIRHLLLLSMEQLPGFIPVDDHFTGAPIAAIQEVLHEMYRTKHWPTIISAAPTNTLTNAGQIFYSLAYPSSLEGLTMSRNRYAALNDLRQIQFLIDTLWSEIQKGVDCIKKIQCHFIHADSDTPGHKFSVSRIVSQQQLPFAPSHLDHTAINTTSTFWRGCILIQKMST